jgi:adenylosuccinate lyase
MEVWHGRGDFASLLKRDKDVAALLSAAQIDAAFDDAYHLRHVDTIFNRVFGAS